MSWNLAAHGPVWSGPQLWGWLYASMALGSSTAGIPRRGTERWRFLVTRVSGKRDGRYCNVDVFDPEPHWRGWLAPGRVPFAIEEAPTAVFNSAGNEHGPKSPRTSMPGKPVP